MMRIFLFALIAMMSLGAVAANAAHPLPRGQQQGDNYNFLEGGGG